ncbi:unnamed protein product [Caenorhabditis sp. 36 PRJEB53466]|nr:unnamed protein product [Caenorhabditis sp. 36 PRJEB53466]
MNFLIKLVIFISIQNVSKEIFAARLTVIEVKLNDKSCTASGLTSNTFDTSSSGKWKVAESWILQRNNKQIMECAVGKLGVTCLCDTDQGSCWDFNEFENAVYMVFRDNESASLPEDIMRRGVGEEDCTLTALNGESGPFSTTLYTANSLPSLQKGGKSLKYQMAKEKLDEQFISDQVFYSCEAKSSPKVCSIANIKRHIRKHLKILSNNHIPDLVGWELDMNSVKGRAMWVPKTPGENQSRSIGGVILMWIVAFLLLLFLSVILRRVSQYELLEHRKSLNPSFFKLRDAEKVISKAFKKGKGSAEETSAMLEAVEWWKNAQEEEQKRDKARQGIVHRSGFLPTPLDHPELGSPRLSKDPLGSPPKLSKDHPGSPPRVPPALSLQKTQEEASNAKVTVKASPSLQSTQTATAAKGQIPVGFQYKNRLK